MPPSAVDVVAGILFVVALVWAFVRATVRDPGGTHGSSSNGAHGGGDGGCGGGDGGGC